MTNLSGGLNTTGSICRKHEEIEQVTGCRDDGFVGGLAYNWLNMLKTRKDRTCHSLSGDEFVGGLEYNWFNRQKTRKDRTSHRLSG
jgi:hypothetical protein